MALPENRPPKVDHIQYVVKVLRVNLEAHLQPVRLINIRARRGIDLKGRIDPPAGKVDAIYYVLPVGLGWSARPVDALLERQAGIALKVEGQAAVKLNSACYPEAWSDLVTKASAHRVALVLRIRKMAARQQSLNVIAQKQAAGHREPCLSQGVGIAQEARKTVPVGKVYLCFRSINDGLLEGDRKTDGGVIDLIVVGIVGNQSPEIVDVQPGLSVEHLGQSCFVVVALRKVRPPSSRTLLGRWQRHLDRTRKQNVLERRRLKNSVIGEMHEKIGGGK
jgi:hypothetical protein